MGAIIEVSGDNGDPLSQKQRVTAGGNGESLAWRDKRRTRTAKLVGKASACIERIELHEHIQRIDHREVDAWRMQVSQLAL